MAGETNLFLMAREPILPGESVYCSIFLAPLLLCSSAYKNDALCGNSSAAKIGSEAPAGIAAVAAPALTWVYMVTTYFKT
jgi:hypothetical protein